MIRGRATPDLILGLARIFIGAVFIYMGLAKAVQPEAFLKLIHAYEAVANPLVLNLVAGLLPWFEVFCGLMLLLGIGVQGASLVLTAMLVPFTILVAWRGAGIAAQAGITFCSVKFDCGCGAGEVFVCHKILENCILTGLTLALTCGRGRWAALRYNLVREARTVHKYPLDNVV